jgi:hypothetical protein
MTRVTTPETQSTEHDPLAERLLISGCVLLVLPVIFFCVVFGFYFLPIFTFWVNGGG